MEEIKSTLDQKEVDHFNKLKDLWWNENSMPFLKHIQKIRLPMVIDGLVKVGKVKPELKDTEKPLKDLKILDIGCGGGLMSEGMAELGATVVGVDAAKDLIECAKLHAKENKNIGDNLTYVNDTIENYQKNNLETFDVVVASEIIEHVDSPDFFIECLIKTLKPNGSIFFTTLNRTTRSWLVGIVLCEYIMNHIGKGTHDWYKFIKPDELNNWLENNNCKKVQSGGWYYSYFSKKFELHPDESVFYYFQAQKK